MSKKKKKGFHNNSLENQLKSSKVSSLKLQLSPTSYFELPKADSVWMQKYNKYQFDLEKEKQRQDEHYQESKQAYKEYWSQKRQKLMNYIDDHGIDRASTKIKTEEDQSNEVAIFETREHIKDCGVNQALPTKLKPPPYTEYLSSNTWKAKRDSILTQCGNACEYCGHDVLKELQVHHNTYQSFPDEHSTDLVVLCKECHHTFHKIVKSRSLRCCSGRRMLNWNGKGKIKKCFLCGRPHTILGKHSRLKEHHHNMGESKRTILVCRVCHEVMKINDSPKEKSARYIIRKKKDSRE